MRWPTAAEVAVGDAARVQEGHAGRNFGRCGQQRAHVRLGTQVRRWCQERAALDRFLCATHILRHSVHLGKAARAECGCK